MSKAAMLKNNAPESDKILGSNESAAAIHAPAGASASARPRM